MSTSRKDRVTTEKKAWSKKFWITLQHHLTKASVKEGLLEADYLFRAILKKKDNSLRIQVGGYASWDKIDPVDFANWNISMAAWGWGTKKALPWNQDVSNMVLKSGVRVYMLHPDGPLPKTFADGAVRRKKILLSIIKNAQSSPAWKKLEMEALSPIDRYKQLEHVSDDELNKSGQIIKQFKYAMAELVWKNEVIPKINQWIQRKGTVPPALAKKWLDAWSWDMTIP